MWFSEACVPPEWNITHPTVKPLFWMSMVLNGWRWLSNLMTFVVHVRMAQRARVPSDLLLCRPPGRRRTRLFWNYFVAALLVWASCARAQLGEESLGSFPFDVYRADFAAATLLLNDALKFDGVTGKTEEERAAIEEAELLKYNMQAEEIQKHKLNAAKKMEDHINQASTNEQAAKAAIAEEHAMLQTESVEISEEIRKSDEGLQRNQLAFDKGFADFEASRAGKKVAAEEMVKRESREVERIEAEINRVFPKDGLSQGT
jgi:hypothetical protein